MYLLCRSVQLFTIKVENKNRAENRVTGFVTGFAQLPRAGGMEDQSAWLMQIFDQFRNGENANAAKTLK